VSVVRNGSGHLAKGSILNPGGRPKTVVGFIKKAQQLCGADGLDMLNVLRTIALDEDARNSDRIAAADTLLSRGYGRVATQEEVVKMDGDKTVKAIDLTPLSPEEIVQLHNLLGKSVDGAKRVRELELQRDSEGGDGDAEDDGEDDGEDPEGQ
jgi:hypothetical protein